MNTEPQQPTAGRRRDALAARLAKHRDDHGVPTDYSYAPSVIRAAWGLQAETTRFFENAPAGQNG